MSMTERIRILLVKHGNMSEAEFARKIGQSPQNFHNKMKRDNFNEEDLTQMAAALNCDLKISFIDKTTNEEV